MYKVQKETFFLSCFMALFLLIGLACEPRGSNRHTIEEENDYEMIEGEDEAPAEDELQEDSIDQDSLDSDDISAMKKLQNESIHYRRMLDSIARINPNITYTYTPSVGGSIKTVLGDFKVEVDKTMTEEDRHHIAVLLEKQFTNRQKMLEFYNKLKDVDHPASPVGGFASFYQELKKNLSYPSGIKTDVEGLLFVQFAVEKNGEITNIKLAERVAEDKDVEESVEKAAVEAIMKTQTTWNAARADGEPVRSKIEIPIWLNEATDS